MVLAPQTSVLCLDHGPYHSCSPLTCDLQITPVIPLQEEVAAKEDLQGQLEEVKKAVEEAEKDLVEDIERKEKMVSSHIPGFSSKRSNFQGPLIRGRFKKM